MTCFGHNKLGGEQANGRKKQNKDRSIQNQTCQDRITKQKWGKLRCYGEIMK